MEQYEFGFNSSIYDALFEETKKGLIPLIEKCIASSKQPDESILQRKCALDLQRKVIMDVVQYFGYSSERGRIDESVHAFTSGYLNDVRITVDYDEKNIVTSYTAALHELGHALYVQNISPKFKFQPVGSYCSAAMDEGQARFLENTIGRDLSFWQFYFTKFKKLTSNTYDDVNLESFVLALNKVAPSPIRVTADPLTYPLHIILRYELEKKLFAEKITVDEIPTYWNESMEQYLGVEITDDSEGVLQDVHFAWGLFGYFPTYALGSFYNAQFISKLSGDIPDWKNQISKGNFFPVIEWLNTNIRVHGNFYDPLILIKEVTGNEFSANYFIKEAKEKYSELYEL